MAENRLPGTEILYVVPGPQDEEQTIYFRDGRVVVWFPRSGKIAATQQIPDEQAIAEKMKANKDKPLTPRVLGV